MEIHSTVKGSLLAQTNVAHKQLLCSMVRESCLCGSNLSFYSFVQADPFVVSIELKEVRTVRKQQIGGL